MQPTDRKRANLVIGGVVGLTLIVGLGWMALQTSRAIPLPEVPIQAPIFDAQWLRLPVPDDVVRAYPARARTERIGERVLVEMRCIITEAGRLEGCAIFNESLPGYGFGEAALKLAGRFEIKTTARDGSSLVGLPVTVPLAFDALFAPDAETKAKP